MSSGDYWYERSEYYESTLQDIADKMNGYVGSKFDLLIAISDILEEAGIAVPKGEYHNNLKENKDYK